MRKGVCLLAALACLAGSSGSSAGAGSGIAPGRTGTNADNSVVARTELSTGEAAAARTEPGAGEAVIAATEPSAPKHGVDPRLRALLRQAVAAQNSFRDRFDAEVWLTDMSNRLAAQVPDPAERIGILKAVHREATRDHISPELVLAVIDVESNFDRYAISSTSALGLMQVMPFWVKEVGGTDKNQLFDVGFNVLLGCRILKYYLDMEDGDFVQALARYNGSTGHRGYADRVLKRLRTKWFWR